MPYTLPAWQDAPSTATPISAANLTQANTAINSIDSRLTTVETGKVSTGLVNAQGNLISANGAGTATALLVGGNGQVLTADSAAATGLKWSTPVAGVGAAITTQDEGTTLTANTTQYNFTGAGVTATNSGGNVTVAVPGGGGLSPTLVNTQAALISATSTGTPTKLDGSGNFGGEVLTADLAQSVGLKWAFPAYGGVQKAGADFTPRAKLNFIGNGVTVADSGGFTTDVTIGSGSLGNLNARTATTSLNGTTTNGPQTVDGIACIAGQDVFYKDSSTGTFNGIYTVSSGTWPRSTSMSNGAVIPNGTLLFVSEGIVNGGILYKLFSATAGAKSATVGTDPISFVKVSSAANKWVPAPLADTSNSYADDVQLPATNGNYQKTISKRTSFGLLDGNPGDFFIVYLAITQDAVGGNAILVSPNTIIWKGVSTDAFNNPVLDLTANSTTVIKLTYCDTLGFIGEV